VIMREITSPANKLEGVRQTSGDREGRSALRHML